MDITKEIAQIKDQYYTGTTMIIDGLPYSQYQILRQIEFYTNSQYLGGQFDEFGRYKPFYNIVNFRVNVAVKATDLDTKDIQVFSENPEHYIKSMIFNKEVKEWMRRSYFSKVLNSAGYSRAKYGGVYLKKTIKKDELCIEVPEWKNLITDTVDPNGVKMEKHYLTPVEIQKKKGIWNKIEENWEEIIKVFESLNGDGMYTKTNRVCVLEVEGEFEKEYIEDIEDENFSLQRHFILCDENEEPICALHSEELKESSYMYCPWLEAPGRTLGIGLVEDGFNAQFSTNDTILKQRDILELASKTVIVSNADTAENNIITDLQVGDIIKIAPNEQMNLLNLLPSSFPALDEVIKQWDDQYSRVSSSFESITGETMPSGTPFRAVAIQNQEAQSTFNYRKEDFGIFLNQVFTKWIIPFIKSKLTKGHILSSDFTDSELMKIDDSFAKYVAKQKVIDNLLAGKVTTQDDYLEAVQAQKDALKQFGTKRFIEVPDGYFKDVEFKLDILTTGEQINKAAVFDTISNMISILAANPQARQDPVLKALLEKAIELSGINIDLDLIEMTTPPQAQPQAQQQPDVSQLQNISQLSGAQGVNQEQPNQQ